MQRQSTIKIQWKYHIVLFFHLVKTSIGYIPCILRGILNVFQSSGTGSYSFNSKLGTEKENSFENQELWNAVAARILGGEGVSSVLEDYFYKYFCIVDKKKVWFFIWHRNALQNTFKSFNGLDKMYMCSLRSNTLKFYCFK